MNLQTKQNIASVAAGLVVVVGLSSFVFFSNQNDIQKGLVQKTEEARSEATSMIEPTEDTYVASGYVMTHKIDVMSEPNENSDIVGEFTYNDLVKYTVHDGDWLKIEHDYLSGYIMSGSLSNKAMPYEVFEVEQTSGFKSFMDYRAITNQSSKQYKLQNLYAETNPYGIRTVNGRYCVAVGSHFTSEIGQYFDLILADGTLIQCVLADQKSDKHTDSNNIVTTHNGCMSEFIVDTNMLNDKTKATGDMSHCGYAWDNFIVQARVYDKNVFDEE